MQGIRQSWPHSRDCQISIECNPEDVQSNYLGTLLNSGVNRLSIGVQSFQQEFLKSLGRNHTIEHLRQNLIALRDVGWTNFNVDLMFGLPMHLNWPNKPLLAKAREFKSLGRTPMKLLLICIYGLRSTW